MGYSEVLHSNKINLIFAAQLVLNYGVMVALQILVLSVQVRILVSQPKMADVLTNIGHYFYSIGFTFS